MRVTPSVLTATTAFTSGAAEPHDPAAYSDVTAYSFGDIRKVVADYAIYEYLQPYDVAVVGKTPNISPYWWRKLGPTETAYDNAKINYALGETCSFNHRCYESLVLQTAVNPLPVLPETQTTSWIDIGPTNKYAMFDLSANTQTVLASPLTVVITPDQRINTIGLCGLSANQVQISATSAAAGGTVYPNAYTASATGIFGLNTRIVNDGYDYAFEPFSTMPSMVVFDVPPYSDIIITITISATTGNVKCGSCVMGTFIYLGDTQYGATNDGLNFSTVTRDLYGNATLVPRRTLPKTDQKLVVSASRVNKVKAARVLLNATPALWTGLDDGQHAYFDMLAILGIYNKFTVGAVYNDKAEVTLGLEEI